MLAAPELLAADDEARHAEDPGLLRRTRDAVDLAPTLASGVIGEAGAVGPGFGEDRSDDRRVLDIQLALPEPLESHVVIAPQHCRALPLGVKQAGGCELRIPIFLR